MWATAPYLKLTYPYPILRGNSCKSSIEARKIYGKCTSSHFFYSVGPQIKWQNDSSFFNLFHVVGPWLSMAVVVPIVVLFVFCLCSAIDGHWAICRLYGRRHAETCLWAYAYSEAQAMPVHRDSSIGPSLFANRIIGNIECFSGKYLDKTMRMRRDESDCAFSAC